MYFSATKKQAINAGPNSICYPFGMAGTSEGRFSRRTGWKLTPNRLTEALLEVRAAGREVLDLTVSNPTRAGIQYDADSILKSLADPAALERAINKRTRAVIVVHPNNPTGSYVTDAERSALNTFCREHRLALMVDEVFLDYAHDGIPRSTFADNQDALTFTLSGLSKIAGLPQMKLGWIAVSGPEKEVSAAMQRLDVIADTYLSLNAPVQLAAATLLEQRKNIQPQLTHR